MEVFLYAELYLICLIILGLILFWMFRGEYNSTAAIRLKTVIVLFMISFASNFLFSLFRGNYLSQPANHLWQYFFKTLYYISLTLAFLNWYSYVCEEVEIRDKDNLELKIMISMVTAIIFYTLANPINHWLFKINDDNSYVCNIGYDLFMLSYLLMTASCSYKAYRYSLRESDPLHKQYMHILIRFPIGIIIAYILSFIGEAVPVICVVFTIQLLCVYEAYSYSQISVDKLTRLNNRRNLLSYLSYKIRNHGEELIMLMIDVDYFKKINDRYGHIVGDEALTEVAQTLKASCSLIGKRPYLARYGGDEFVILIDGTIEDVEELKKLIRDNLKILNSKNGKSYDLALSIGHAVYEEGMAVDDFIEIADKRMYEDKKKRR